MTRTADDNSQPLYNVDDKPEGLWARQVAAGEYMELKLDSAFANSLNNNRNVKVSITYKDAGTGGFEAEVFGKKFSHALTGTDQWLTCTKNFVVDKLTDMRITAINNALILHRIELERDVPHVSGDALVPSPPSGLFVSIYPVPFNSEIIIRV
ncbi:MAG TPA: hypothetical protein VK872_17290, partial [Draconibacterium sp.]|nr:hypothetical protein [Draconibacterium sp.]